MGGRGRSKRKIRTKVSSYADQGLGYEVRFRFLHYDTDRNTLDAVLDFVRNNVARYKIVRSHTQSWRQAIVVYVAKDADLVLLKLAGMDEHCFRIYRLVSPVKTTAVGT